MRSFKTEYHALLLDYSLSQKKFTKTTFHHTYWSECFKKLWNWPNIQNDSILTFSGTVIGEDFQALEKYGALSAKCVLIKDDQTIESESETLETSIKCKSGCFVNYL